MPTWLTALFGTLAATITLTSGALTLFVLYRSKNAEVIKGEMEAWKSKAERLDADYKKLSVQSHDKDVEIEGLKARTDLSEIRKGQSAIVELIAKQSAAILENQTSGLERGHKIELAMTQMVATLEKMEKRLDRGLIMK